MNQNKKILIVGGTGFIGYHLAKKSLKKGWKVTSISSKPPKKIRYLPKVEYLFCDISNKTSLRKKIKKNFKYVVNLGGHVDHSNKKKTFNSHFIGCKNLSSIFLKKKIDTFVQMGSSSEYGTATSPHKENLKCKTKSIYGNAKLLATSYLIDLFKRKKFPSVVLRLYQSYGPKQDLNRFIPIIISSCIKNKKFPCSQGNQLRDFVYVEDVVDAIIKSLTNSKAKGQIINIGSGKTQKLKSVIRFISNSLKGGYPQFGMVKLRKDEIMKSYPSISKAINKINWKSKTMFKIGIRKTIKYYKKNEI